MTPILVVFALLHTLSSESCTGCDIRAPHVSAGSSISACTGSITLDSATLILVRGRRENRARMLLTVVSAAAVSPRGIGQRTLRPGRSRAQREVETVEHGRTKCGSTFTNPNSNPHPQGARPRTRRFLWRIREAASRSRQFSTTPA